jgi:hypothetical protein
VSWLRPDQRPIVDFPEGRDWLCDDVTCFGRKPEEEGGTPTLGCPDCGGPMSRIVVQL